MNIELIKKFIRLANHNPNDHEANSAARRVCRMIEAAGFPFKSESSFSERGYTPPPSQPPPKSPKNYVIYDEVSYINWEDLFKSFEKEDVKYGSPFQNPNREHRPEKRERTCVECGATVETRRITTIFRCDKCKWKIYGSPVKPKDNGPLA